MVENQNYDFDAEHEMVLGDGDDVVEQEDGCTDEGWVTLSPADIAKLNHWLDARNECALEETADDDGMVVRGGVPFSQDEVAADTHVMAGDRATGPPIGVAPHDPVNFENARRFLERVRVWGGPEFLGIHHTKPNPKGGKPFWNGTPVRSVDDAIKHLKRIAQKEDVRDIYVALGTQRETETKTTKDGRLFEVALRTKDNTVSFRTLFADLDVKDGAYASRKEAMDGLYKFIEEAGLPQVSMAVASGTGGLHCYWVLDRDVPAEEWHQLGQALANAGLKHGLKFDAQCSYDFARVLRIPDTHNFKRGEPLPVELRYCDDADIPVEAMAAALGPYKGLKLAKESGAEKVPPNNPLTTGLEPQARLRNIDEVAKHCDWVRDSLETGGQDNNNALRLMAYKLATACEDTDDVAWRMVCERKTLGKDNPDEFENELERAKRDVELNPKLAWPSCETIAAAGAKACQSCQYKDAGCKPLTVPPPLAAQEQAPLVDCALPDIRGGRYTPGEAMQEVSARFALVDTGGEVNVIHRNRYGEDVVLIKTGFQQWLSNVYVTIPQGEGKADKVELAAPWWMHNPNRPPIRSGVFKPHGPVSDDEYNFWRGFGVKPCFGSRKMRRFLRHLWKVICKGDPKKFKYFIRWLAWAVQNPDKPPETAIVIKGEGEGSGKSTVSTVMLKIFGRHGMKISSPEQMFGAHCDYLEHKSFLMVEEALFAGNPAIADRVKDFITGPTVHINPKGRRAYEVTNILHAILTTNHDWAVPAGPNARRWFVLEVDEGKTFNRAYFDALYGDMEEGGYGEFLNFLLSVKLGNWHPRNIHRTKELADQQVLSANSVLQWLLFIAEEGGVVRYCERGSILSVDALGTGIRTERLYKSYCDHMKVGGGKRTESRVMFGRVLKKVLGEDAYRHNLKDASDGSYSPGYIFPDAPMLHELTMKAILGKAK